MPPLDTKALSTEVAGTLNRALTPLLERMASIEARLGPLVDVRDRLVVVETKCSLPVASSQADEQRLASALTPVLERVAAVEARMSPLGDVRDRLVAVETKCCAAAIPMGPDQVAEQRLVSALERLSTLEYAIRRAEAHESEIADLKARLAAAEAVAGQYSELAAQARQLVDRVTAVEAKSGQVTVDPVRIATDFAEFRAAVGVLSDLPKDIGALRERVAVVEVRQPMPGPAGRDGNDGKDGRDGSDGFGFNDLAVVQDDDERTFKFQGERDGRVKVFGTFVVPAEMYRGVWAESQGYVKGDCVTWAGSEWHCNEPTVLKPGEGSKAWTLKVKRGRDGRDGKDATPLPVVSVGRT